jgi:hypothetical protein
MLPRLLPAVLLVTLVGCAASSSRPRSVASTTQTSVEPHHDYATTASALVFDPPASRYLPPLDLSRDGRAPAAFAGFQQASNTVTFSWTDDHQSTDFFDSYDRHTLTVQIGSSVR